MSKEQTPIENIQDIINNQFLTREEKLSEIVKNVKVYTNIKVLEALEPQREFIEELLTIFDGNGVPNIRYVTKLINQYYETEVKPKYNVK